MQVGISAVGAMVKAHPYIAAGAAVLGLFLLKPTKRVPEVWAAKVLPHGRLERIMGSVFHVEGTLRHGPPRRMVVAQLPGGEGTIINSGIAVDEATLAAVVELGQPKVLIAPNAFHREDAAEWKARFPDMLVTCPSGAVAALAKVGLTPDFDAIELPTRYPHTFKAAYPVPGWNPSAAFELVLEYNVGGGNVCLAVTDTFFNMKPPAELVPKVITWLLDNASPNGRPVVSRLGRFFMKSKATVAEFFRTCAARGDIVALLCAHGDVVTDAAIVPECFHQLAACIS